MGIGDEVEGAATGMAARGEVKTLSKGLQVLDLLIERHEIRTGEASRLLGIDKGGASRLLQTLVRSGFAEPCENRGFRLTRKLGGQPSATRPSASLKERARPLLTQLAETTGETAHLAIPADENVLYLDAIDTPLPLRVDRPAGTLAPAYCTALGNVLLALGNLPMPRELRAHTPNTITDPGRFEEHLRRIAERRYALDDEAYHVGVRCAAAPLCDATGAVIAAIGISGPTARIDSQRLAELGLLLRDAAAAFRG